MPKTNVSERAQILVIINGCNDHAEREGDGCVALCAELDIASQGDTLEGGRANLIEALTLFFETADASEIGQRLHSDVFVTQVEVPVG
jgi:predicted RNase H-like HicB family nuclease